jgi:type I restriction-modification system DNA methylase subunit
MNNQLDKDLISEHNELIKLKINSSRIYDIRMEIFKKYRITWSDETGLIDVDLDYNPIQKISNKKEELENKINDISMEVKDVLKECTINGLVVHLPNHQLERKLYQEVAKSLELIGGKWKGGKVMGFVFDMDPTDLLKSIQNGDKRNLKKEFQFFATPAEIADWLVELADIQPDDTILEPSAGQGAIYEAIKRKHSEAKVTCVEIMEQNSLILSKKKITHYFQDFLTSECTFNFDKIIANPPFSKNQDIYHIYKMVECCKSGGRIVSVSSTHWELSQNKKETEFREFLKGMKADIHYIAPGQFKESGTMVGACVIVLNI